MDLFPRLNSESSGEAVEIVIQIYKVTRCHFDKVPHKRLQYKLQYYGIKGSTHKWIASWLSERYQEVVLDGQASDPVPLLSGVPQGSVPRIGLGTGPYLDIY